MTGTTELKLDRKGEAGKDGSKNKEKNQGMASKERRRRREDPGSRVGCERERVEERGRDDKERESENGALS